MTKTLSGVLCPILIMMFMFGGAGWSFADDRNAISKSSGDVYEEPIEPLPYIVVGVLVAFGGLIIYDTIAHPYEKDKTPKPINADKTDSNNTVYIDDKADSKLPGYSNQYDTLLGISSAEQKVNHLNRVVKGSKAKE